MIRQWKCLWLVDIAKMIQKSLNCTNKSSPNILLSIWYILYKTLKHILKRGMHYWSLIKNQFLSLSPSKVTNLSLIFAFQLELLNDTHCWGNRRQKRKVENICCFIFKYYFYKYISRLKSISLATLFRYVSANLLMHNKTY